MKKIRINNDIDISITVKKDGFAEDLANKQIKLTLDIRSAKIPIIDYRIDGNVISFRYSAKEQFALGAYSITLQVIDENGMNTVDKCNVFELVYSSCEIGGQDEPNVQTVSLDYSFDTKLDAGGTSQGGVIEIDKLKQEVAATNTKIDTLIGGNVSEAIDNFKEVESFLQGIVDTESLTGLLTKEKQELTSYVDKEVQTALNTITGQVDEINNLVGTDTEGGAA